MYFQAFLLDSNESNAYLVGCSETHEAILIDAGCYDRRIGGFLLQSELSLKYIFLTHDHFDHTDGIPDFLDECEGEIEVIGAFPTSYGGRVIRHGDEIAVGRLRGRFLDTSGHTPDSYSLVLEERMVFVGDALFAGSIGGAVGEAREREIENIRRNIFTLGDHVEIYPGHGPATLVGIERQKNPFFL
ncbi:MAG TPA: MBL fold metallo-hydrolase [bacterium]|nr:MBL fold metallo-hydrolase [bacterium]HPO07472.1 MBL fold metallo-hydrolase [bacterium]HQO36246.1 MBL fold metallo-hydrolase [bacterium]HQP99062.1 MBL fold metallo-hydrolase [bacterium]